MALNFCCNGAFGGGGENGLAERGYFLDKILPGDEALPGPVKFFEQFVEFTVVAGDPVEEVGFESFGGD